MHFDANSFLFRRWKEEFLRGFASVRFFSILRNPVKAFFVKNLKSFIPSTLAVTAAQMVENLAMDLKDLSSMTTSGEL